MTTNWNKPLVVTEEDIAHTCHVALVGGIFFGLLIAGLIALLLIGMGLKPRAIVGAPEILSQSATETVARVPTLINGESGACTITINHKHRSWAVNC